MDYEDQHNTKLGADVCEHVLEVTEKILQEASSNRPVLTRSLSQPVRLTPSTLFITRVGFRPLSAKCVST